MAAVADTARIDTAEIGTNGEDSASGRRLALDVHARLRTMILIGELRPGSVLLQAKMARTLGVSRTPMREAFRLLQEEGLIEARPDQRARVRSVDPLDLDTVYGSRIALEALAASMTVCTLGAADFHRIQQAVDLMRLHNEDPRPERWHLAHREFHEILTQAAGPTLQRSLTSLREHSERYIRLGQLGVPGSWTRGQQEHELILDALRRGDETTVIHTLARHLARTALSVLADIAPEYEPVTTRTALRMTTDDSFSPSTTTSYDERGR